MDYKEENVRGGVKERRYISNHVNITIRQRSGNSSRVKSKDSESILITGIAPEKRDGLQAALQAKLNGAEVTVPPEMKPAIQIYFDKVSSSHVKTVADCL